ncbi:MAG: glycerate kinase [Spirochaetia bacterium]|jgi:hydroxypyruvate reductase|nr:glycerate kinase [Spirochaetia bacterium]
MRDAREDAEAIFAKALEGVIPGRLLERSVTREGRELRISHDRGQFSLDLDAYRHVLVLGFGKASGELAVSLEAILGDRIEDGFVVTKAVGRNRCKRLRLAEASHPVPDSRSMAAGREALALAAQARAWEAAGEPTLVLMLISGGGSALLCLPAEGLSLDDKAGTTKLLLASGARIGEMNAVRKHLSGIKGGRLAEAFYPATLVSLVLSDVMGDDLDTIASGPTVPDSSTWEDATEILRRRGLWESIPVRVRRHLEEGLQGTKPDTPKPGSRVFEKAWSFILGNNLLALKQARSEALERGYSCLVLSSRLEGEAREIARVFSAMAVDMERYGLPLARPACILAGSETTVTLRGKGRGGRNQEMALAFLCALEDCKALDLNLAFLSAGTDGADGPTDAAGAFALPSMVGQARAMSLDPANFLADNDSYTFFASLGGLLKTGPTGTNVCDVQILLMP